MSSPSSTLDGLPKQFVTAMRTLFDIMDDKRTGCVSFAEIENRWQDDDAKGLPKGVIESLRKVTPASGSLSFERFCAGLKICLLRNQVDRKPDHCRSPSTVPNVVKPALLGPPKPPRTAAGLDRAAGAGNPDRPGAGNLDRAEIRTALQQWQLGQMMSDQQESNKGGEKRQQFAGGLLRTGRSMGDGKAAVQPEGGIYQKKANARRREPRRHTLQNGIDYNMLKRMKQIEQEKEVLMQGLAAVEKARDWYLKQVAVVQDKMKYLGRMGHVEHWSEAQQERLELQRARVIEVNRHLAALTESWERGGLPLHMNLAVHHYPPAHAPPQDLSGRLKQQNRLLTEEVSKKSERISALEREKANLIQFLQTRSSVPSSRINVQEEAVF